MRRNIVTAAMFVAMLCCAAMPLKSADIQVNPSSPLFAFPSLAWGNTSSTSLGFNNNFFFSPLSPNESVCVFVYNNNPTNLHTYVINITGTANTSEKTPSDGTWTTIVSQPGNVLAQASPSQPSGVGAPVSGYALISVNFSNSSTQAGSPDTASVFISQTPGSCSTASNFLFGNAPNSTAIRPIQTISDSTSQGFSVGNAVTNPLANGVILHINAAAGTHTVYFDRVVISTSASGQINTVLTGTTGSTCSTFTPISIHSGSSVSSTAVANASCTVNPSTQATLSQMFFGANSTFTYDLTGIIIPIGANGGVDVSVPAAITGTVTANFYWYER